MNILSFLAVPIAYLIGSFPSAYIVGRCYKINLLKEGDGHISATAVYRLLGWLPFIIVLLLDIAKGMLAVYCAQLLTDYQLIILAAGLAAVLGHCWSIFIKFRGGLGATITYSIIFFLMPVPFLIGAAVAILALVFTRKSSIGTIVLIAAISVTLCIQILLSINKDAIILIPYPFILILAQYLKRLQIKKSETSSQYHNELFEDLKRVK